MVLRHNHRLDDPMKQTPPRPSFALTLGVTGHRLRRDVPDAGRQTASPSLREDRVKAGIDDFLVLLMSAVGELREAANEWFDPAPPLIALVSSLAEGSDRIAAQSALALGMPLDVVLPCARPDYEQTFADDSSRAEFAGLFDQARARLILPLAFGPGAAREERLAQAYESAGLTMLAQADILIAVWDGEPAKGRGGTGDIVDDAARQGTPIVVINPVDGAARLLWPGSGPFALPARRARDLPIAAVDKNALIEIAKGLILPPASAHERTGLRMFLTTSAEMGEDPRPAGSPASSLMRSRPDAASPSNKRAATRLTEAFIAAERIAQHNARCFRAAFVCNFFFGAVAAVLIGCSSIYNDWHHWFVSGELALVLGVTGSTFWAVHKRWHRRWFEAREVAERLRVAETFWMLGVWPHNLTPAQPAWSGWYARAVLRAQPLFSGDLAELLADARKTLATLVEDQRAYHADNSKKLARRDRSLELGGLFFLGLSVANGIVFLVAKWDAWTVLPKLSAYNLALAIALPAAAAAIYGIRLFGDYEDIVRRSQRTGKALLALQPLLDKDTDDLLTLRARAGQSATAMLSDLEAWRVAVESRYLSAA
jgi:hypothetical protein